LQSNLSGVSDGVQKCSSAQQQEDSLCQSAGSLQAWVEPSRNSPLLHAARKAEKFCRLALLLAELSRIGIEGRKNLVEIWAPDLPNVNVDPFSTNVAGGGIDGPHGGLGFGSNANQGSNTPTRHYTHTL
jgi:hypothetical protein